MHNTRKLLLVPIFFHFIKFLLEGNPQTEIETAYEIILGSSSLKSCYLNIKHEEFTIPSYVCREPTKLV